MKKMNKTIAQHILFTGAGFTKNFAGFLATEMWTKIFNHSEVQNYPYLRELLLDDFDYESIYYKVLSGNYSADEKEAIQNAIFEAYQKLDAIACEYTPITETSKASIHAGAKQLIDQFIRDINQINFFFTLNQDLFIERIFGDTKKPIMTLNMVKIFIPGSIDSRLPLSVNNFIKTPNQNMTTHEPASNLSHKELHYIKLHGSYGWKSSDGTNKMVIGQNKKSQIAEEPLLAYYFDLFKQTLAQKERKLLAIGYGFGDEHVNRVIAESIKNHGLEVYILSPTDPNRFITALKEETYAHGKVILSGLKGYFPYELAKKFPADQSKTDAWEEIRNCYFGNH